MTIVEIIALTASILSAVLYFLFKGEQSKRATAEAKGVAAEQKGKLSEVQEQSQAAEAAAADSRSEYERIASKHRE